MLYKTDEIIELVLNCLHISVFVPSQRTTRSFQITEYVWRIPEGETMTSADLCNKITIHNVPSYFPAQIFLLMAWIQIGKLY